MVVDKIMVVYLSLYIVPTERLPPPDKSGSSLSRDGTHSHQIRFPTGSAVWKAVSPPLVSMKTASVYLYQLPQQTGLWPCFQLAPS